jgi:N12 class adenine-specific DNA methylase
MMDMLELRRFGLIDKLVIVVPNHSCCATSAARSGLPPVRLAPDL